jgi:hypothetical protein
MWVFTFQTQRLEYVKDPWKYFSLRQSYFPIFMKSGFDALTKVFTDKNAGYLAGVVYNNKYIQLGITGKMKRKESITQSMHRELCEEIGFGFGKTSDIVYVSYNRNGKSSSAVAYVKVSDLVPALEDTQTNWNDIKSRRVGVFVHAENIDDIQNMLELYKNRWEASDTKTITHLFFADIVECKKIVNILTKDTYLNG